MYGVPPNNLALTVLLRYRCKAVFVDRKDSSLRTAPFIAYFSQFIQM